MCTVWTEKNTPVNQLNGFGMCLSNVGMVGSCAGERLSLRCEGSGLYLKRQEEVSADTGTLSTGVERAVEFMKSKGLLWT